MPRFAWALFAALLLAGGAVGMESGGASSSGGGGWGWSVYEGHMGFTAQEWARWYEEQGGGAGAGAGTRPPPPPQPELPDPRQLEPPRPAIKKKRRGDPPSGSGEACVAARIADGTPPGCDPDATALRSRCDRAAIRCDRAAIPMRPGCPLLPRACPAT